jgi:hypothetical protein
MSVKRRILPESYGEQIAQQTPSRPHRGKFSTLISPGAKPRVSERSEDPGGLTVPKTHPYQSLTPSYTAYRLDTL